MLVLLFYSLIIIAIAIALVALSLDILTLERISYFYHLSNFKPIAGAVGGALIIISFFVLRVSLAYAAAKKKVRFKSGHGLVTVSLSAIEDLTRHLLKQFPEIKVMRPHLSANRKGLEVLIKATLYTNASIPEVTEKIQHCIKTRLEETLGAEKNITVRIQIDKIEQVDAGSGRL